MQDEKWSAERMPGAGAVLVMVASTEGRNQFRLMHMYQTRPHHLPGLKVSAPAAEEVQIVKGTYQVAR